MGRSHVTARN